MNNKLLKYILVKLYKNPGKDNYNTYGLILPNYNLKIKIDNLMNREMLNIIIITFKFLDKILIISEVRYH